uniref:Uncharacterized protein n=1 Tax=Tetranychus urticae TaxID=32264 RepID=T1L5U4_TETUR
MWFARSDHGSEHRFRIANRSLRVSSSALRPYTPLGSSSPTSAYLGYIPHSSAFN